MTSKSRNLTIVVVGASGDLARKKIFPALFALYSQGFLPERFTIMGFARSAFTHAQFRARVMEHLTCRYTPGHQCADRMREFLERCFYAQGAYDSTEAYLDLYQTLREQEPADPPADRIYYLAIPPNVFLDVARALGDAGLVMCGEGSPWSRVIIEKPFGRDRASSDALTEGLSQVFSEHQTFRIDHYLGKEVVQNLMVLRFANRVFEPIWNARHVAAIEISWREEIGVEGRGGYFDHYGIIRDVMQNHLLQILALTTMEPPARLDSSAVRDEKVRVLRAIPPVALDELVVGQYTAGRRGDRVIPGYADAPDVPPGSITPTFAAAVLAIRNERWQGVPVLIKAAKAADERHTTIRLKFRPVPRNVFCAPGPCPDANDLVIRVQPDEGIHLNINTKIPGLDMRLGVESLNLRYQAAFDDVLIPDAYETLLLDVIRGDRSLFIRGDELAAAWDIFTPALQALEARGARPEPYAFGSAGPTAAHELAVRHGCA